MSIYRPIPIIRTSFTHDLQKTISIVSKHVKINMYICVYVCMGVCVAVYIYVPNTGKCLCSCLFIYTRGVIVNEFLLLNEQVYQVPVQDQKEEL